jgi:hypothetical protein
MLLTYIHGYELMDASSTFSEKRVRKRKAKDRNPRESTVRDIAGKLWIFIHST